MLSKTIVSQRGKIVRHDWQTLQLTITECWRSTACGHGLAQVKLEGCGWLGRMVEDYVELGGEDKGLVAQRS